MTIIKISDVVVIVDVVVVVSQYISVNISLGWEKMNLSGVFLLAFVWQITTTATRKW